MLEPIRESRGDERDRPFDVSGVVRGRDGVARYTELPDSLAWLLIDAAGRHGGRVALVDPVAGVTLTYAELLERARRVAGGLRGLGCSPGTRVALRIPNSAELVAAFFAVQLLGCVAVPVNPRLRPEEIVRVLGESGAQLTVGGERELPESAPLPDPVAVRPEQPAALLHTAGTTRLPEPTELSHENLLSGCESALRCLPSGRHGEPELASLIALPLALASALTMQLLPAIALGRPAILLASAFDITGICDAIDAHGARHLLCPPSTYAALLRRARAAQLELGVIASALITGEAGSAALVERLEGALPAARLGCAYTCTEAAGLAAFLPHEQLLEHPEAAGYAVPVIDIAIGAPDQDGELELAPADGSGEVLLDGASVTRPGAAAQGDAALAPQAIDGWIATGDLGALTQDGLLTILDRSREAITIGEEVVHSLAVERVLAGAPAVAEAAVFGVGDDMSGERVGAVLVPVAGRQIDLNLVLGHARSRLPRKAVPRYISLREFPFPRSSSGSVLKRTLRQETNWGPQLE